MKRISIGKYTSPIRDAAMFIIGHYFYAGDYGKNLKAYDLANGEIGVRLSNIFGDRRFISLRWEGPNNGYRQFGEANLRLFEIRKDHGKEDAITALFNLGKDYGHGYVEVISVNEEHVETHAKLFDKEEVMDLIHYVNTQKTNPSKQNRTFVRATGQEYQFIVVDQNMGYSW